MERIKDFFRSYKITASILIFNFFVNLYMLLTMVIPSHQYSQWGWFNLIMDPWILIAFVYEYPKIMYDPDTSDFKTWHTFAVILVVAYFAAISIYFGIPAQSIY